MSDEKFRIIKSIDTKPQHDFVVIKAIEDHAIEVTAGGIIIPHSVQNNKKTQVGEVIAAGPGRYDATTGKQIPMQTKVGDKVIFALMIGYPIQLGTKGLHYLIKDYDVMSKFTMEVQELDDVNAAEVQSDEHHEVA